MILSALSVLASIATLNIAHLPRKRQPSRTMRRLCHVLCRLICMINVYAHPDVSTATCSSSQIVPETESDSNENVAKQTTKTTTTIVREEEADYSEEHAFYSMVIDRSLFWIFLFVNLVLIIGMLAIYPLTSAPNFNADQGRNQPMIS